MFLSETNFWGSLTECLGLTPGGDSHQYKKDGVLMVSFKVELLPLRVFSSYCTYLKKNIPGDKVPWNWYPLGAKKVSSDTNKTGSWYIYVLVVLF